MGPVRVTPRLPAAALLMLWAPLVAADTLLLDTGEKLSGTVVSEEGTVLVFRSDALGELKVPRERVKTIERTVVLKDVESAPPAATVAAAQADGKPAPEPDRTATELPEQKAEPVVAPVQARRDDLLRLWVDQGLRYQIVQPVVIPVPWSDGEAVVKEEVRVTGRIGVRASGDVAGFETGNGLAPIGSDAALRTLRFYTTGDWSPTTSYALQLGVIDGEFYLHQANVRWREVPWVSNVSFGYLTVQQTLENVAPFGGNTFMEPGLPVLAFAPGNRMGVQVDRMLRGGRSSMTLGLYSVGADPGLSFGDQTQSLVRPTARFTALPLLEEGGKGGRRLLHLGVSGALTLAAESEVRYRARPESFLAPFLVDTRNLDSRGAAFAGGEAVYMQGPFTLQGEAMVNRAEGTDRAYVFGGAYVSAALMLTGEEAAYNKAVGIPERIIPNREFSAKAGTWGAWQVAARLSYLDLTSGPVEGGRILESTLGLNWWWNRYLRWQMNYGYANVEGGATPGRLQIIQGRVQLMY